MNRICRILLCFAVLCSSVCLFATGAGAVTGGKLIALTFDDGPGKPTAGLLDGLKERGIHATFFMLGECAENYPATAARAYREGHQIANHSWNHANMIYLSGRDVAEEFRRTDEVLMKSSGKASDFLARVPYGNYNDAVRAAVGAPIIGWSIDPLDWKYRSAETVRKNIVSAAFDGAIILVHDIHPTSAEGALRAVDDLTAAGYEFVTVRELFRRRGIDLQNGVVYRSAPPNGIDSGPVKPPVVKASLESGKLLVTVSADEGAEIWCTLDGSDPALYGWKYIAPFEGWGGLTVRAVAAYTLNGSRSDETVVTLTNPRAEAPVMTVEDGRMTLTASDRGQELYYTADGSSADRNSARYEDPVAVEPGTLLRAIAAGEKWLDSEETAGWYSPGGRFFRDVTPGDWFADAVDQVVGAGWLQGIGNNRFSPSAPLSRGQLATILFRMAGEPSGTEKISFPDVKETDYFFEAAQWAVSAGIAECGKDGSFSPGSSVTREILAVMLDRTLLQMGAERDEGKSPREFKDADEIDPSAKEAVETVSSLGLLIGDTDGHFRPKASLTRAETAVILTRVYQLVHGE